MKTLKFLIEKMDDTLEEIEEYAEKAHVVRHDHKVLADCYIKVAEMHVSIYGMLHDRVVELIKEEHERGNVPHPAMAAIWEFEHEKLIKKLSDAKSLIDDFKRTY